MLLLTCQEYVQKCSQERDMNLKVLSPSSALKLFLFLSISYVAYNLYCLFSNPYEPQSLRGSDVVQTNGKAINNKEEDLDYANFLVASLEALTKTAEESNRLITRIQGSNDFKVDGSEKNPLSPDLFEKNNAEEQRWRTQLLSKLTRIRKPSSLGGIFFYHMRKAAGTTVRDLLTAASDRWGTTFYESEGPSLNKVFLDQNLLLVTSLRDPIKRIYSLYWYEHVGWFDGVLHETEKCKSLMTWIEGWRDGSKWKDDFTLKNPGSVYIEVENYYVKALSGWTGPSPVGELEYNMAVSALDRFDIVFVTEWMDETDQKEAMNTLFSISPENAGTSKSRNSGLQIKMHQVGHELKGDNSAKERLSPSLANDQVGG